MEGDKKDSIKSIVEEGFEEAHSKLTEAKSKLKTESFEEAMTLAEEALKLALKITEDELAYPNAKYYFTYADILLAKLNSEQDIFGDEFQKAIARKAREAKIAEEEGEEDEEIPNEEIKDEEEVKEGPKENGIEEGNPEEEKKVEEDNTKETPADIEGEPKVTILEGEDPKEEGSESQSENESGSLEEGEEVKEGEEAKEGEEPKEGDPEGGGSQKANDDAQYVWENLETARVILERKLNEVDGGKEPALHIQIIQELSRVIIRIGDYYSYQEKTPEAIEEYNKALEFKIYSEQSDSRELAQIYFLLACAYLSQNGMEPKALTNMHQARYILERRLSNLLGTQFKEEEKINYDLIVVLPFDGDEVQELKSILREIYNKVEETIDQLDSLPTLQKEIERVKEEINNNGEGEDGFGAPKLGDAEVKDLGVLGGNSSKEKKEGSNSAKRTHSQMESRDQELEIQPETKKFKLQDVENEQIP